MSVNCCNNYTTLLNELDGTAYSMIYRSNSVYQHEKCKFSPYIEQIKLPPIVAMASVGRHANVFLSNTGELWFNRIDTSSTNQINACGSFGFEKEVKQVVCSFKDVYCITSSNDLYVATGVTIVIKPFSLYRKNVQKISCGDDFLFILDLEGKIYSMGQNYDGQLALGDTTSRTNFVNINCSLDIIHFVSGNHHSIFLDSHGFVYGAGNNYSGQLGLQIGQAEVLTPISQLSDIVQISCGNERSMMIDSSNNLYILGQFGSQRFESIKVFHENVSMMSSGGTHIVFKDCSGDIWALGSNHYLQLCIGDYESRTQPVKWEIDSSKYLSQKSISYAKSARK